MYEKLYEDNRRLIRYVAQRFWYACQRDRAVSVEDLEQAGFFGVVKAAEIFDETKGISWARWATREIVAEIYKALGYRDGRFTKAHTRACSLDAPQVADDPESMTGVDMLADDTLPDIDADINLDDLRRLVREAVADLKNDRQRDLIQACALDGKPYREAAAAHGISIERVRQIIRDGHQQLKRDRRIKALADIELRVPYYEKRTLTKFRTTNTSATEHAALWHLDQLDRLYGRDRGHQLHDADGDPGDEAAAGHHRHDAGGDPGESAEQPPTPEN